MCKNYILLLLLCLCACVAEICLKGLNDKQENLTDKVKDLGDLQCRLEESFDEEFRHYM